MKIGMTGVHVNNPLEAFDFYTNVLGFERHTYMPEYNLAIVVSAEDAKGTTLLLEPNDNPIAKAYQEGLYRLGIPCIVFSVTDIYKEADRLRGLGVKFNKEPVTTDFGIEAVFDDTCGNYIMLFQDLK